MGNGGEGWGREEGGEVREGKGENNLNPYLMSYTQKIDTNWIIGLNIKAKTIKLLKENIAENLCDLGVGKYFLEHKEHKT